MGGATWRHALHAHMNGDVVPSRRTKYLLAPLWGASHLYRGFLAGYWLGYETGLWRSRRLPCRVISVGNVTLGGTGKTPFTIWLAQWCRQQGWSVAVLSRGYGSRGSAACRVVSAGDGPCVDWRTAGDEPYLMARRLPGVPVIVGKNRYVTGQYACDRFGVRVVILDDGFQHRTLARDLDVVLVDASNPFGVGSLVPRGALRESPRALRRADVVVLSRADIPTSEVSKVREHIRRWCRRQPLYAVTAVPEALYRGDTSIAEGPAWLARRRVVAFAGIGNPQAFAATLIRLGVHIEALLAFPDHHVYTAADWCAMIDIARRRNVECLVTTEKDAVRLPPSWQKPLPVYTLRIGIWFSSGQQALQHRVRRLMESG
jgi:tetraacyldisaccharide 4'-kinase